MQEQNESHAGAWIVTGIVIVLLGVGAYYLFRPSANTSYNTPTDTTGSTTSSPTAGTLIHSYGTVTLGLGQSASFPGITITPTSVAQDSRCATGVQCVQAGTVQVVVQSTLADGATQSNTIALGSTIQVDAYSIALTSVNPEKTSGSTISSSDYRFTFDVHTSASGVGLQGKG